MAETVSEKDLVAYLIDEDSKTTVLKIFKEQRYGESQANYV